mmetsp:Transcript_2809/g.5025  ORF Transcript_2809/g.5025 Transcript_2809/m.5025 type:complete len:302 (+) Transcript_2809:82-987(+)
MSSRIASAMVCLLATTAPTPIVGFAPSSSSSSVAATQRTTTSSSSSSSSTSPLQMSSAPLTEDMYPQLLSNASLCANSESCSIESAELYLREIVYIQSGCAAGTLSGNAVCNDVLEVSEVVAGLRVKIGEGAKQGVKTFWDKRQEEFEVLATASLDGSSTAGLTAPLKPAYLALAALFTIAVISMGQPATMDASAGGVVPFTAQEVWWAIRDGYAGELTSHLFRDGGLVVSDAVGSVGSSPSPQELFWSIRDGYAGDALFSSSGGGVESVPFTPQEVGWAIQNGYAYDMVEHWFRNGGLSV